MAKKKTTKTTKTTRRRGSADEELAVPQNSSVVVHDHGELASVEFSRDAKGVARWSIKLTGGRGDADSLIDEVLALDGKLREETQGDG